MSGRRLIDFEEDLQPAMSADETLRAASLSAIDPVPNVGRRTRRIVSSARAVLTRVVPGSGTSSVNPV